MKSIFKVFVVLSFYLKLSLSPAFGQCNPPDPIINGGFENGNAGFGTSLTFQDPFNAISFPNYTYGYYAVTSSAVLQQGGYNGFPNSNSNNMLVVDGFLPGLLPGVIWNQTATGLTPGCCYSFSFFIRAVSGAGNASFLNVFFDNNILLLGPIGTTNVWQQFTGTFIANSNTSLIQIVQIAGAAQGFDFAIDDITITAGIGCMPETCRAICLDNIADDFAQHMILLNDGSIAINGTIGDAFPSTDRDMYVFQLDPALNLAAAFSAKRIGDFNGTQKLEDGSDIIQGTDGFLYAVGTVSVTGMNRDVLVTRLEPNSFNIIWSFRYGTIDHDESGVKILEGPMDQITGLRSFIIGGSRRNIVTGGTFDVFAFKIDENGTYNTTVNTHLYYGKGTDDFLNNGIRLISAPDEFVLTGETTKSGNQDLFALRININTLNLVSPGTYFTGQFASNSNEVANGIIENGQNLLITGYTNWVGNGGSDAILIRMPVNFNNPQLTVYGSTYGASNNVNAQEIGLDLTTSNDGNFVIVGNNETLGSSTRRDGWIFKVDASSYSPLWSRKLSNITDPYIGYDSFNDIIEMNSGQIAVSGTTGLNGTDQEILIALMDQDGLNCCVEDYPIDVRYTPLHPGNSISQSVTDFNSFVYLGELIDFCSNELCGFRNYGQKIEANYFNQDSNENLLVYPNPTVGNFSILTKDPNELIYHFVIRQLDGKKIIEQSLVGESNSNIFEINLENYSKGIYLLEVFTNNGKYTNKVVLH